MSMPEQAPCLGGAGSSPSPACCAGDEAGSQQSRGEGALVSQHSGGQGEGPEAASSAAVGRGREPYLLQMLQWWVRAGLGAMHFLQMETPVRSFLACTQVRRGLYTQVLLPSPPALPSLAASIWGRHPAKPPPGWFSCPQCPAGRGCTASQCLTCGGCPGEVVMAL